MALGRLMAVKASVVSCKVLCVSLCPNSMAIGQILAENCVMWLSGHSTSVGSARLAFSSRLDHPTFNPALRIFSLFPFSQESREDFEILLPLIACWKSLIVGIHLRTTVHPEGRKVCTQIHLAIFRSR